MFDTICKIQSINLHESLSMNGKVILILAILKDKAGLMLPSILTNFSYTSKNVIGYCSANMISRMISFAFLIEIFIFLR